MELPCGFAVAMRKRVTNTEGLLKEAKSTKQLKRTVRTSDYRIDLHRMPLLLLFLAHIICTGGQPAGLSAHALAKPKDG